MALVRNNLSLRMKGRAGSFSFYSSKGRQVARVAQNSSNYGESARRSEAQQKRRVKWANLVNFYKLMGGTLHGAYETKRTNETDYNAFMRKNIPTGTVALTKEQAALGCCACQSFRISEGSILSSGLKYENNGGDMMYTTRIVLGDQISFTELPISTFSSAVIANNSDLEEGMQISIITINTEDTADGPRSTMGRYELTLSTEDSRMLSAVFPFTMVKTDDNNRLAFLDFNEDNFWAVIISDSTSGSLRVSSESLVPGDTSVAATYSTEEAVAKAMESYGVDAARFLDSGDMQ